MSEAYLQLRNNWYTHPKFCGISGETFKSFLTALAYCSDLENDGWLPNESILGLMGQSHIDDLYARRLLDRIYTSIEGQVVRAECSESKLISNPLIPNGNLNGIPAGNLHVTQQSTTQQIIQSNQIKSTDVLIGWGIHNYTKYQPSKSEILKRRKEWSDRKALAKLKKTQEDPLKSQSSSKQDGEAY